MASGAAFLSSQLLDIRLFDLLRRRAWWVAPLASTAVSSALDSAVFVTAAFYGTDKPWVTWGLGDYAAKLGMGVLSLGPFRWLTRGRASIT